ncbi:MAG TPA: PLP-dependent aminotransferase family protein [Amycolatopsis sp.]|nr:PLP-dependent aminotransferase family protein [Amycolatopsis sp.]
MPHHRHLIEGAGLTTAPVPVDAYGADPRALPTSAGAVLLTPSHQHPRGVVLSAERRAAFLAWAASRDGFLLEDDYDGEFRYDKLPGGALQPAAPDRVVFAGSTSKALAPGLRIGWLVLPERLRIPVLDALVLSGATVGAPAQLALADLLTRGDYDRQVRRARTAYRTRRAELAAHLTTPLDGVPAGLHALLPLDGPAEERRLVDAALTAGLRLQGLHTSGYWHSPAATKAGLILGFSTPPRHSWRRALDVLAEVLEGAAVTSW